MSEIPTEAVPPLESLREALATGRPVLVERELLPDGAGREAFDATVPGLPDDPEGAFVFASPDTGELRLGRGECDAVELVQGQGVADALDAVIGREGVAMGAGGLRAVPLRYHGGIAFHGSVSDPAWRGFGSGRFVLPRIELVREAQGRVLRRDWLAADMAATDALRQLGEPFVRAPAALPRCVAEASCQLASRDAREGFEADVRTVLEAIAVGEVEKVVLARRDRMRLAAPVSPSSLFAAMRRCFPACFHFLFRAPGGALFAGASPERLARLQKGCITTMALAGSAARDGSSLLASAKDREEHRIVVDGIRRRLESAGIEVRADEAPDVLELANIRHLRTALVGHSTEVARLRQAAAALHPTPAVGGRPTESALRLIRTLEDEMRGWYAAPCGWIESSGDAELIVALRSALIWRDEALLFAGAGIVAGSEPGAEFEETQLKMGAMRVLLREAMAHD